MKITRRTALLGVAGGVIGGVPVAAAQPSLWATWQPLDLRTGTKKGKPTVVLRDGQGGFITYYPDGRIEPFAAPFPDWGCHLTSRYD